MTSIDFRTARLADLPSIVALLAEDKVGSHRESTGLPLDERYVAAFKAIEADPNQRLVVAVHEHMVVGTLQLSFIPGIARVGAWRGQIEAVRVAAPLRSSGIGRRMLEWALSECRSRGCKLVQLTNAGGMPIGSTRRSASLRATKATSWSCSLRRTPGSEFAPDGVRRPLQLQSNGPRNVETTVALKAGNRCHQHAGKPDQTVNAKLHGTPLRDRFNCKKPPVVHRLEV